MSELSLSTDIIGSIGIRSHWKTARAFLSTKGFVEGFVPEESYQDLLHVLSGIGPVLSEHSVKIAKISVYSGKPPEQDSEGELLRRFALGASEELAVSVHETVLTSNSRLCCSCEPADELEEK